MKRAYRRRQNGARKSAVLNVPVTEQEKAAVARIAAMNHQTLSQFVLDAVREAIADCTDEQVFQQQQEAV